MVQIRNVPAEFHRRLKARAAMEGMSMSDCILREVGKALERPTRREVLEPVYVALAEVLDGLLLTCDGPLSRAPGLAADRVVLVQAESTNR
jgi:plasmid stability protein